MNDDEKPKRRLPRGGPPPTGLEARKNSGKLCTATRRNGQPCTNFAILGGPVCRVHGGNLPVVRRAAQVRLLQAADLLMAELLKIALDTKVPVQHRLVAIRDGLDRADLGAKATVDVNLHKGKGFDDFVEAALVDTAAEDDDDNIRDAEVVTDDDEPATSGDEYRGNRFDRALEASVADTHLRARPAVGRVPGLVGPKERARLEAQERRALMGIVGDEPEDDEFEDEDPLPERRMPREQLLLSREPGSGYDPSSRGAAGRVRAAENARTGKRSPRVTEGRTGR